MQDVQDEQVSQAPGTTEVTTAAALRELVGEPGHRAATKSRGRLSEPHRQWLAACPFLVLGTSASDGTGDVSPKGDPPGFVKVLDDTTIAIPERAGNRRVDSYLNILGNPQVGLLFIIPGRDDSMRINGRAKIISEAPFFDSMLVRGHRPKLALVVSVEEVFFHCSKAFMRSGLWHQESWRPEDVPSRARIAHQLERSDQTLETVEAYYSSPSYADGLYPVSPE